MAWLQRVSQTQHDETTGAVAAAAATNKATVAAQAAIINALVAAPQTTDADIDALNAGTF